jgi:uncharacterized membrane protein
MNQGYPARRQVGCLPLMLLVVILPAAFFLFFIILAQDAFRVLGLSRQAAFGLVVASLVGAMINIPLSRRNVPLAQPATAQTPDWVQQMMGVFHYYPPPVVEQVIAINVGGALVPVGFSIYLLTLHTTSLIAAAIATVIVAAISFLLARPVPGVGISLPGFVPPIAAALASYLLVHFGHLGTAIPPVAYISGTMGTLIGADLLNLPLVARGGLLAAGPGGLLGLPPGYDGRKHPQILSIGGAGVFDGIFFTGIIAPLLA